MAYRYDCVVMADQCMCAVQQAMNGVYYLGNRYSMGGKAMSYVAVTVDALFPNQSFPYFCCATFNSVTLTTT